MSKTISPAQAAALKARLLQRRKARSIEAQYSRRHRRSGSVPPDAFRVPDREFQVEINEPEVRSARTLPFPDEMPAAINALEEEAERIERGAQSTNDNSFENITRPGGDRIRRPANCFIIFRNAWRREYIQETPKADFVAVSKSAGVAWRALSREEQELYHERARAVVWAHKVLFPKWKYKPTKKVELEEGVKEEKPEPKPMKAPRKRNRAPKDDSKKSNTAAKRKIEEEEEEWKAPVSKRRRTGNGTRKNVKKRVVKVEAKDEETPEPAFPSLDGLPPVQSPVAPSPFRYWETPSPYQIQSWEANFGQYEEPSQSFQGYQQAGPSRLQDDQQTDGSGGSPGASLDFEHGPSISSHYGSQVPAPVPSPGRGITGLPPSSQWFNNAPFGSLPALNMPTAPSNEPLIDPSLFTGINGYRLGDGFQSPQYNFSASDNYYLPADANLQSDDFIDSMDRVEQASQEFYRRLDSGYAQDQGFAPALQYPVEQPQYQYLMGYGVHGDADANAYGGQDAQGSAHFDTPPKAGGTGLSGLPNDGPSYYGHANQAQ